MFSLKPPRHISTLPFTTGTSLLSRLPMSAIPRIATKIFLRLDWSLRAMSGHVAHKRGL